MHVVGHLKPATSSKQLGSAQIYSPSHHFAQTISRSSNLHQQIYGHPRSLAALNYYDQSHQFSLAVRAPKERSILPQVSQRHQQHQIYQEPHQVNLMSLVEHQARLNKPLCRCRVMYLGSSVPHITKNGLHGIQEPLRHLYPEEQFSPSNLATKQQQSTNSSTVIENTIDISHLSSSLGIDSWLSVWSNGLLLENVDEFGREIKRFFSIESLHYCAAVRFFDTSTLTAQANSQQQQDLLESDQVDSKIVTNEQQQQQQTQSPDAESVRHKQQLDGSTNTPTRKGVARFLPLDAPIFQCPGMMDANHPPVFAAIMRRTTGIKVLECHAFICRRDAAANALVRCCTHAYADFLNAKRLSAELGGLQAQSGYYFGPESLSSRDDMVARRRRSVSVGRQKRHHVPSYQVVEAIIDSAARDPLDRGINKSSSTSASNETDNSLEISSEDNYAIIPKQNSHSQKQSTTDGHKLMTTRGSKPNERRRSRTKPHDKTKGSSKSLFNDFMPQPITSPTSGESIPNEKEKLSHSLDYLQMTSCCADGKLINSDDPNENVQYSIVTNKRHSKSMQNLDRLFEFNASSPVRLSTRNRRRRYHQRVSSISSNGEKARKAASFQDMSINVPYHRKGSISSELTIHSCGSQSRSKQVQQQKEPTKNDSDNRIYDTCLDTYANQSSSPNYDSQHYDHNSNLTVVKADTFMSNKTNPLGGSSKMTKNSGKRARHHDLVNQSISSRSNGLGGTAGDGHRSSRLNQALAPIPPPPPPSNPGYYQHFGVGNTTYSHHPASIGIYHHQQSPVHPIYMHPYYMPYQQQIYSSAPVSGGGHVCDTTGTHYLTPYPGQCHILEQLAAGRMYANGMATIATNNSNKSGKSSLARFRCLSPPVNFLTNSDRKEKRKGISARTSEISTVDRTSQQFQTATTNAQQPVQQSTSSLAQNGHQKQDLGSSSEALTTDVVSARPGFISSARAQSDHLKGRKLSWIKRLSLTMSSGGQHSGDDLSHGGTISSCSSQKVTNLSIDPCGSSAGQLDEQNGPGQQGQAKQQKQKRKRSSLFSGSLTLGRSSNKQTHNKLIMSQQT